MIIDTNYHIFYTHYNHNQNHFQYIKQNKINGHMNILQEK